MNDNIKEENNDLFNVQNGSTSETDIYKQNKAVSKNKVSIFEFVLTTTKIDCTFETLEGYLYWGGIAEFFIWLILIGLFFSDVRKMKMIWFFVYHIPKCTLGLIILHYLPKSYEAIDKIDQIESDDLEVIKKQIIDIYVNILVGKERVLKPLLISYFALTIISMIVDILLFCVITPDFGAKDVELTFAIVFFAVIFFIVEDFMFVLLFSGFKYTYPPNQNEAIKKALMGFFTQLKVGIAVGFTNLAKKIQSRTNNINKSDSKNPIEVNNNNNCNDNDNNNNKQENCNVEIRDSNNIVNEFNG